jgi:hypothetical protein
VSEVIEYDVIVFVEIEVNFKSGAVIDSKGWWTIFQESVKICLKDLSAELRTIGIVAELVCFIGACSLILPRKSSQEPALRDSHSKTDPQTMGIFGMHDGSGHHAASWR